MSRVVLSGMNGTSPLGFMASLGVLRLAQRADPQARLGFLADGSFQPYIEGFEGALPELVARDAADAAGPQGWRLTYAKEEKRGTNTVADLKAPPDVFRGFLAGSIERWLAGDGEAVAYAAAYGTSVAVDGKGNTKPTAFHFTAANQQFLATVELVRAAVTVQWAERSLFRGAAALPGSNLRWDPAAERNWALMADNPNKEGTQVDAPAEWLAFRGMALLPTFPVGTRVVTTGVTGRGDEMRFSWPLWSVPVGSASLRSLLALPWTELTVEERLRGVFAVCSSAIRRTPQGFGNFGPASVTA